MARAIDHFKQLGFAVTDVIARDSYNLDCHEDTERLRVEVNGTETKGEIIILSRNEVRLARQHQPHTALVVVHAIRCDITIDGPRATGGAVCVIQPWKPDEADLSAISYECKLFQVGERRR